MNGNAPMFATVHEWGDESAVCIPIPQSMAEELHFDTGDCVRLSVSNGALVMTPVAVFPSFDLDTLVAGITDDNAHPETDSGCAIGNEVF